MIKKELISISNIKRPLILLTTILILTLLLTSCDFIDEIDNFVEKDFIVDEEGLLVHFIDVGQGDSTLIEFPNGEIALIDGGPRSSSENLLNYLKASNIKKIDYLIATHPHEDHIGGLPEVIRNFEIDKVYMPERTANTNIFKELLETIKDKDKKIKIAKSGDILIDEDNIKFYFLAPVKNTYENTNDFSIVSKIEYGKTGIIIMGDAERVSEKDILSLKSNLKADVLRVGHHGSSTSSTEEFLEEVKAKDYVISLGKDNSYGHPHREVVESINKRNGNIYRTDEMGDILMSSDGNKIIFNKNNQEIKKEVGNNIYIGNKNTEIFHSEACNSLPNKENQIIFNSKDEAIKKGFKSHNCVK